MSVQSKYFQVTPQVMLEYMTDEFKILKKPNDATDSSIYMLNDLNGNQQCVILDNQSEHAKLPQQSYASTSISDYFYPGTAQDISINAMSQTELIAGELQVNETAVGDILNSSLGVSERTVKCYKDTIRIYLTTGYMMNSLSGYHLKVKSHVDVVRNGSSSLYLKNAYITLIDWYMPKEELKDRIHWMPQPLYFTKSYYDRYVEIDFPSPFDIAQNERAIDYTYEAEDGTIYRGFPNPNDAVIIEFSSVNDTTAIEYSGTTNSQNFLPDAPVEIGVKRASNSNYFNIRLEEDQDTNSILYYPAFGEGSSASDLDLATMLSIESGAIPMIDLSNMDQANEGMDDFLETFGDDADKIFKWIIINELSIRYNYKPIIAKTDSTAESQNYSYTEYYTNTIDYTGKTDSQGAFWRNKFIPYVKEIAGMSCGSISVQYTCHLYNRMNNMNITRIGSMLVNDPYKYQLSAINTSNIYSYKVINKISKTDITTKKQETEVSEKYIKSFYNATNVMLKETNGQLYSDGQATLHLHRTNSNYVLRLYTTNSDNARVPLNLAGSYKYKLVFSGINNNAIEVFPNEDSVDYNLGIGSLIFYITGSTAKQIMTVPASERYFAIMTSIDGGQNYETTVYEGKVAWIN